MTLTNLTVKDLCDITNVVVTDRDDYIDADYLLDGCKVWLQIRRQLLIDFIGDSEIDLHCTNKLTGANFWWTPDTYLTSNLHSVTSSYLKQNLK